MSSNLIPEQIQPKDEQNDFNNCSNFYKWNFNELDKIGEGGFGSVFKVSHKVDQMLYAIKIIKINDSTNTENILKEVKTLSKLNSDYVIRYYNSWFENESIFIQTELCSYNLDEFIKKKRSFFNRSKYETMNKLEYFISTHIFKDIIECVQYLHESNPVLIHRDLKPENILIKENAENDKFIKLGDFGLAKSSSKDTAIHTKNVGTPKYMAPEIYSDTYSFKVDIYSLGEIGNDLFEYDINEPNHNICDELRDKWNILYEMIDKMLKKKFRERPTCAEMIAAWNSYSIYISEQDRHDLIQSDNPDNFFSKLIESNSVKLFNYFSKNLEIHIQRQYKEEMERFLQNKLFVNKQTLNRNQTRILKNTIDKYSPEKGQISKNLRLDVRRHYKEEMEKFLQNKLFVNKQTLNRNHKTIIKTTIDKYSPEKGHLTQENFEELVNDSITDIFIKIQEDNEVRRPQNSPAIGIDLGTTNSCVAYFDTNLRGNNVVVIPNEFGHNTTPSVVSFRDNNLTIIGDVAKDDIHAHLRNTISSAKRLIGRQFNDESVQSHMNLWSYKVIENQNNNPMICVKVDGIEKTYKPEEISAQVLIKMKSIAENHLGCSVSKAVITVPAYFNDAQKDATKHAGRLAGLEVLRIINEPTAAAIAFKVDRNEEKEIPKVLIYDFGGGTFDVSILEINRGVIEVLAVGGDNNLGGDDFDTKLITYCLEQFKDQHNLELQGVEGEGAMCRLRPECEIHKMRLSAVESTILSITNFYENHDLSVRLTRDKFEELNKHLFVKSMNLVKTTLADKNILPSDIDDIVLVGGSTRIPKIQELLSQLFGGRPLNHSVNPDEAVAKGAAIQAALLNAVDNKTSFDLDIQHLRLGLTSQEIQEQTNKIQKFVLNVQNNRVSDICERPVPEDEPKSIQNQDSIDPEIDSSRLELKAYYDIKNRIENNTTLEPFIRENIEQQLAEILTIIESEDSNKQKFIKDFGFLEKFEQFLK